jgi:phage-related protein
MVSAPGGGIEVEVSTSGVRRAKNALDSLARGAAKARAAMIGMSGGFRRVGRTAPRATSRVRGFARSLRSIGTEKAFSLRTIAAAIGTLGTAAVGAATPVAGLGAAAGGIGAALLGGIKAAKNSEDRLEKLKKSAQEAIRPLRAFSDLSFGVLQAGVSLLGDLATMLASLETPITSVVNKWGEAFSGEKISIITELKKTILQFLGPIRDLGLYIINNLAPALETLRTAGVNALPAVKSLLSGIMSSIAPFVEFSTTVLSAVVPALNRLGGIVLTAVKRIRSFYDGLRSTGALTELSALLTRVTGILGRFAGEIGRARSLGVLFGTMLSTVVGYAQRFVSFLQKAKLAVDTFVAGFAATGAIQAYSRYLSQVRKTIVALLPGLDRLRVSHQQAAAAGTKAGQALKALATTLGTLWGAARPLAAILRSQLLVAFNALKQALVALRPTLQRARKNFQKKIPVLVRFGKALLSLIGPLGELAVAIGTVLVPVLVGFSEGLWAVFKPLAKMLTPALNALGPIISKVASRIQSWALKNQSLLRTVGKVAGVIAGLFAPLSQLAFSFTRVIGVVGRFVPGLARLISMFGRTGTALRALGSRFVSFGIRAPKAVTSAFSRITSATRSAMGVVRSVISSGWRAVTSTTRSATGAVRSTVSAGWRAVRSTTASAVNAVASRVTQGWSRLTTAVVRGMNRAKTIAQSSWGRIRSLTASALGRIRSLVASAMRRVVSAFRSGMDRARSAVSSGISRAVGIVRSAGSRFLSAGKSLMRSFARGISRAAGQVTGAVGDVVSSVRNKLPGSDAKEGPLSDLSSAGPAIPKMLADGMQRYRRRVKKAAETVAAAANVRAAGSFRGRTRTGRTRTSRAGSGPSGTVSRAVARSVAASARRRPVAGGGDTIYQTPITVDATIAASSRAEGAAAGDALLERLNALTPTK